MFTKTLLPDTLRAIQLVSGVTEIKKAYLAGGTALALQIGHRISVDLDFFTQEEFNEIELSAKLALLPEFIQDGTAKWTVWGKIGETKLSIFYYKYPLLGHTLPFEGLQLASLADITAMKIHAIEDRGTKRDFIDAYFLAKKYSVEEMLDFYQKKYGVLEDHMYAILRSLDYFEDADQESEMPKMLIDVSWEKVKEYFRKETYLLTEKKLQSQE
ncbi:nucleotidyl transferase AbiEii/AbiGii toxin family protein [Patescibacteria group bacterium]|nr:nucleotidyl transferase AbiEii/AbiGii toxin family protein [Patescibacteria group bacterium]MBU4016618.1 nucleotidyl transferase AbiEii/AbiGii toxin family protein [Patescibacteria group bacterium]MBU4098379.1 nucleotidyl transferase AbiEii/AbiGii toxin family protein [Patescibacteria group bacterium]